MGLNNSRHDTFLFNLICVPSGHMTSSNIWTCVSNFKKCIAGCVNQSGPRLVFTISAIATRDQTGNGTNEKCSIGDNDVTILRPASVSKTQHPSKVSDEYHFADVFSVCVMTYFLCKHSLEHFLKGKIKPSCHQLLAELRTWKTHQPGFDSAVVRRQNTGTFFQYPLMVYNR